MWTTRGAEAAERAGVPSRCVPEAWCCISLVFIHISHLSLSFQVRSRVRWNSSPFGPVKRAIERHGKSNTAAAFSAFVAAVRTYAGDELSTADDASVRTEAADGADATDAVVAAADAEAAAAVAASAGAASAVAPAAAGGGASPDAAAIVPPNVLQWKMSHPSFRAVAPRAGHHVRGLPPGAHRALYFAPGVRAGGAGGARPADDDTWAEALMHPLRANAGCLALAAALVPLVTAVAAMSYMGRW